MTLSDLRASVAAAVDACSKIATDHPDVYSAPDAQEWLEGGRVYDRTADAMVPVDGAASHLLAALDCIDAALGAVRDFEESLGRAAE